MRCTSPPLSLASAALALLLLAAGCATWGAEGPPPTALNFPQAERTALATLVMPRAASAAEAPQSLRAAAPQRQPVVVLLHGGFSGEDRATARLAQALAQRGVLAVVPSYRGEPRALDGQRSPGRVEFCAGEVDDVLALLTNLRARADVDPERIALWGFSHGGCIALRVAERAPQLAAVVTFAAPVELGAVYRHLRAHPCGLFGYAGLLRRRIHRYVGAEPSEAPAEWARRSPVHDAAKLQQPLVLVHGTADSLVPVQQACLLRDALQHSGRAVQERAFDSRGEPRVPSSAAPPPACPAPTAAAAPAALTPAPTTTAQPPPPAAEVWYYEGQGHLFSRRARVAAQQRAMEHLLALLRAKPAS